MSPGSATIQLVTFEVPGSSTEPMEVKIAHSGLRMVLVSRESIGLLDQSWKVLGVYFLLGAATDPDHYTAYVGEVGKSSLIQRVRQHAAQKDWWGRALLIASASNEFNSAEIGWLEGRLYDVLNNAVACELKNGNRPGDDSLSLGQRGALERYVEPIMASLRALGASPDTADQKPEIKGRKKPIRYTGNVADLIGAGLLKPETILQPLPKRVTQTAQVLADGKLKVGAVVYDSPSSAAKAAAGTSSEPGWDFWGAPSGTGAFVPLAELRERLQKTGAAVTETPLTTPAVPKTVPPQPATTSPKLPKASAKVPALAPVAKKRPELFPLTIFSTYRGTRVEAVAEASGVIRLGSETFTSPSLAAAAARRSVGYTGSGKAATNGWTFWRFIDDDGEEKRLDELRR